MTRRGRSAMSIPLREDLALDGFKFRLEVRFGEALFLCFSPGLPAKVLEAGPGGQPLQPLVFGHGKNHHF